MSKNIEKMNNYELSRWYALMEAVDLIDTTCQTLKKDFDILHLNPIAIKEFINDTSIKMERDLDNGKDNNINDSIIKALIEKIKVEDLESKKILKV